MRLRAVIAPPSPVQRMLSDAVGGHTHAGELAVLAPTEMVVVLEEFGNVARTDAVRLGAVLRRVAASVDQLRLRLSGADALQRPGDRGVWSMLGGDVTPLASLASAIAAEVKYAGFLVDRRVFHPQIRVAEITDSTTEAGLQDALDRLGAVQGQWMTVEVVLQGLQLSGDELHAKVVQTFPLRPASEPTGPHAELVKRLLAARAPRGV